jgi:hypothetical protein
LLKSLIRDKKMEDRKFNARLINLGYWKCPKCNQSSFFIFNQFSRIGIERFYLTMTCQECRASITGYFDNPEWLIDKENLWEIEGYNQNL